MDFADLRQSCCMGMRGRTEGTAEDWLRVALRLEKRMKELRMDTQAVLVQRAEVSDATVRHLQAADQMTYRTETLRKVSRALFWPAEAIERIVGGEEPVTESEQVNTRLVSARKRVDELEAEIAAEGEDASGDLYVLLADAEAHLTAAMRATERWMEREAGITDENRKERTATLRPPPTISQQVRALEDRFVLAEQAIEQLQVQVGSLVRLLELREDREAL